MAEQVVFSNQQNQSGQPVPQAPQPPQQGAPNPFAPPQTGMLPTSVPQAVVTPQGVSYSPPDTKGKVLKIVLGVVGVFVFLVLFFKLIVPMFASKDKQEDVTLTYWGLWEDENVMKTIISDFERSHPHIKISYQTQDKSKYKELVQTRIQQGNGPDIFRYHNSWVPTIYPSLLPLPDSVISPSDFKKAYYPVIQSDLIRKGGIYGIPLQIDTLALFVNKDAFAAGSIPYPKSWYDFANAAAKLTIVDGSQNNKINTAGAALGTYDNITHASDIISLLLAQSGVDLRDIGKSPQFVADALTYYVSFAESGSNSQPVWNKDLNPSLVSFTQGNLAMYFGYSWDIFAIDAAQPTFKYDIIPVPYLEVPPPKNAIKTTIASYWVEGVSKKTKHPKEAFAFMNYLTKKETLQKLYTTETKQREFGELYPRTDMANLLEKTRVHVFVDEAKDATSTYFSSNTYDDTFDETLNGYLQGAINDMLANSSPDTVVGTLTKQFDQTLNGF